MPEETVIANTVTPLSAESLTAQLRHCGLADGQVVLVQLAMSKLGWVIGAAEGVIIALLDAVGPTGTIMMVSHSSNNTDPSEWRYPPVGPEWWPFVREHTPPYNPLTTPTRGIGVVPELFRTWPGVRRSSHPAFSMAAVGPHADFLTEVHDLTYDAGDQSPLGRLYELDGYVLLLGVGHSNNSSLHLAEVRADYPGKRLIPSGSSMLVDGRRTWVAYPSFEVYPDDFETVGTAFEQAHSIPIQHINTAEVRFFRQRLLVDFAAGWMQENRDLRNKEA
ncbi:MAG TPA: AAC(3) family N-acetyltransferase [Roseiflexaceae bacterium]|nr:AAC(3) family N-acetyltransferase [Roseiflexaceae bacterium]HMP42168.1 AAC(3) family N-acetyltransferase [Roseiflexaceae bacterium]